MFGVSLKSVRSCISIFCKFCIFCMGYMVLYGIAWYCMDIVVVAQKVKVVDEDQCDLKKWVVVVYH